MDETLLPEFANRVLAALASVGRPATGPVATVKTWGRACLQTVPTETGTLWAKHGYRLPPGEERVLERMAVRWPGRVPEVVATWRGGVVMEPLPGRELQPDDPQEDWVAAASALAEVAAGERPFAKEWIGMGVRDRRPECWAAAVETLLESPVVRSIEADLLGRFEALVPEFITRYERGFLSPATLVHQDSGCCNIHLTVDGPLLFDWADVVIGHPTFSCDRLLDQAAKEHRDPIIDAFREPLGLAREEFDAMRRSNVLHEVLRYHDELAWIPEDDPAHISLAESVRSQIRVLVEHEWPRR